MVDVSSARCLNACVMDHSAVFSPLYRQVKASIMRGLQVGQWKPGEPIPSEVELAARFGVSQGTVRKAIDELAAEHLLVRRQGKGTFVASHHEAPAQFRFLRLRTDDGEIEPPQRTILECRRLRAPAEVARRLELRPSETAMLVRRLLSFGAVPTVLDDIWLPGALFRGLTADRLAAYHGPLYALFETEFAVRMVRCEERLRAVAADAAAAPLLKVSQGEPLLFVDRTSFTYGDRPVEVRRGLYLTRAMHYHNELN